MAHNQNNADTPDRGAEEAEEEIFIDCGASPELRRSARTSSRKRASTGGQSSNKPKKRDKKMAQPQGTQEASSPATPLPQQTGGPTGPTPNPFSSLGATPGDPLLAGMQAMLTGMEGRLSMATANLQANVTVKIDGAMAAIGDLRTRVDKQDEKIDGIIDNVTSKIHEEIHRITGKPPVDPLDSGFPRLVAPDGTDSLNPDESSRRYSSSYASALASLPPESIMEPARPAGSKRENDYWIARKALRIRPIKDGDPVRSTKDYLSQILNLDEVTIESLGPFRAERVPFGPKSRQKHEMLVRFGSVEARDIVKGAASNLAGRGSDYGIRLELPNHLKTAMKHLQQISYDIRTKYPDARRNVLYDDASLDLVLDFCLTDGQAWRRLTAAQARERLKKKRTVVGRETLGEAELDDILDGRGRSTGGSGAANE